MSQKPKAVGKYSNEPIPMAAIETGDRVLLDYDSNHADSDRVQSVGTVIGEPTIETMLIELDDGRIREFQWEGLVFMRDGDHRGRNMGTDGKLSRLQSVDPTLDNDGGVT